MPHTLDPSRVEEILETIKDEHMHRLNKWETGFIESVIDQHDRMGHLSEPQMETLEKIWLKMP